MLEEEQLAKKQQCSILRELLNSSLTHIYITISTMFIYHHHFFWISNEPRSIDRSGKLLYEKESIWIPADRLPVTQKMSDRYLDISIYICKHTFFAVGAMSILRSYKPEILFSVVLQGGVTISNALKILALPSFFGK